MKRILTICVCILMVFPAFADVLTLDAVFPQTKADLSRYDKNKLITVLATGDVMLARAVNMKMYRRYDYTYPFRKLMPLLRSADLALINLECPIVPSAKPTNEGMVFSCPPQVISGIKEAGIDVVNLANNHSLDQGEEGLIYTKELLKAALINFCDDEDIAFREIKGVKFAFVGFNFLSPTISEDQMAASIQKAGAKADVVVAQAHWGNEYTYYPNLRQKTLAHELVDAGADLVIGNHPHFVQGVEIYKDKFIAYSHGNFIFDQNWSDETEAGVVGKYTFLGNKLVNVEFIPIQIKNLCQPAFAPEGLSKAILEHMKKSSISADGNAANKQGR